MRNTQKGFTLIELLVVIAIIGILATIVLTSLGSARNKANDTKIQGQLSSMRAAAEIYYSSNNSYGTSTLTGVGCDGAGVGMFADTSSGMKNLGLAANYPGGAAPECNSNGSAWAASHVSASDTGTFYCVDSTGVSKVTTANITTGVTCP